MNKIANYLIVFCTLAIFYAIIGHGYVQFYFGGKAEFLDLASAINRLCNTNRACPELPEGWQAVSGGEGNVRKGNIHYFPVVRDIEPDSSAKPVVREFSLVYGFFAPDHWFEAQGGVDRKITSGWKKKGTEG